MTFEYRSSHNNGRFSSRGHSSGTGRSTYFESSSESPYRADLRSQIYTSASSGIRYGRDSLGGRYDQARYGASSLYSRNNDLYNRNYREDSQGMLNRQNSKPVNKRMNSGSFQGVPPHRQYFGSHASNFQHGAGSSNFTSFKPLMSVASSYHKRTLTGRVANSAYKFQNLQRKQKRKLRARLKRAKSEDKNHSKSATDKIQTCERKNPNTLTLHCIHCKKSYKSFKTYSAHLIGYSHKKAMNTLHRKLQLKFNRLRMEQKQQLEFLAEESNATGVKTFCKLCKLSHMQTNEDHENSDQHIKIKQFIFRTCEICDMKFQTAFMYEHHVASVSHLKKKVALDKLDEAEGDLMVLDAVGASDDSENEMETEEGKIGSAEKKNRALTIFGVDHVTKVTSYFCDLCSTFFQYDPNENEEQKLLIHCRSSRHLKQYLINKKQKEAMEKKVEIAAAAAVEAEQNQETNATTGEEKENLTNLEETDVCVCIKDSKSLKNETACTDDNASGKSCDELKNSKEESVIEEVATDNMKGIVEQVTKNICEIDSTDSLEIQISAKEAVELSKYDIQFEEFSSDQEKVLYDCSVKHDS